MTSERFLLNGRYLVDPSMNSVRDLTHDEGIRLEARVMILLCLLAQHVGHLATREMLVKAIWNDYGGADEALSQSVSTLRKVLQDTSKTMIETIPKKGYVLHASFAVVAIEPALLTATTHFERPKNGFIYPVLVVLLSGFVVWYFFIKSAKSQPTSNSRIPTTDVPFEQVSQPAREHYANTITTVAADSTRYKLILQGDRRPAFYINDRLLLPDELEPHLALIEQMTTELKKRQKGPDDPSN